MAITGEKATIKIKTTSGESSSVVVKEMNSWELNIKVDTVDTSSFDGDGWAENETSLKSWECSIEGFYNKTDTTGQKAILSNMLARTKIDVELYYDKASETPDYKGQVVITEFKTGAKVKDGINVSYSCTGSGALTGDAMTVA